MRFLIPLILLAAISCAGNNDSKKTSDGSIADTDLSDTCDCNDLVIDSLGAHYLHDSLFTGICVSYFVNTKSKYIEKSLLKGKLHGKVLFYDKSGEILLQEYYENGKQKRSGITDKSLTCDCNELVMRSNTDPTIPSQYWLDDMPYSGKCEKYYPDSEQLSLEVNYKNGYQDGYTIYYNRDGSTILMERYTSGILVSTVN